MYIYITMYKYVKIYIHTYIYRYTFFHVLINGKSSIHGHVWFPEGWHTAGTTDRKHQEFGARRLCHQSTSLKQPFRRCQEVFLLLWNNWGIAHRTPGQKDQQMWREQPGMFCHPKQGPKVLAGIPSSQADSRLPHRRRNLQASAQTCSQLGDLSMFSLGQSSKCRTGATKED